MFGTGHGTLLKEEEHLASMYGKRLSVDQLLQTLQQQPHPSCNWFTTQILEAQENKGIGGKQQVGRNMSFTNKLE